MLETGGTEPMQISTSSKLKMLLVNWSSVSLLLDNQTLIVKVTCMKWLSKPLYLTLCDANMHLSALHTVALASENEKREFV